MRTPPKLTHKPHCCMYACTLVVYSTPNCVLNFPKSTLTLSVQKYFLFFHFSFSRESFRGRIWKKGKLSFTLSFSGQRFSSSGSGIECRGIVSLTMLTICRYSIHPNDISPLWSLIIIPSRNVMLLRNVGSRIFACYKTSKSSVGQCCSKRKQQQLLASLSL